MQILGFTGVGLITICTLPQLIKIIRTRKVRDISILFWVLRTVGACFQLVYAVSIKDTIFCAGAAMTFGLSFITLFLVWRLK